MPTIPSGLKPVVEGYSFGGPAGVMRTPVDGGAPRYALEWDRGVQQFRVTLVLDALQFSVWTTFYHHTIKKGALAFDMPLDSGYGSQTHSVNVIPGTYNATRTSGVMTTVTFGVEAESAAYGMSAADAAALLALYEEYEGYSSALLQALDLFANQYTLALGTP
jgi:hypothetical protein